MGSFTEVVLSFDFADSTPDHVIAAFSALHQPGNPRVQAPSVPAPVVEAWPGWAPDWRDAGYPEGQGDPFENEPWRHNWAFWVSLAMGGETTAHGLLVWSDSGAWNLDCRFSWKVDPWGASEALAWLAPYVDPGQVQRKVLVGYALDEGAPRPHLLWVDDGRWELEDLNPDDQWMQG